MKKQDCLAHLILAMEFVLEDGADKVDLSLYRERLNKVGEYHASRALSIPQEEQQMLWLLDRMLNKFEGKVVIQTKIGDGDIL